MAVSSKWSAGVVPGTSQNMIVESGTALAQPSKGLIWVAAPDPWGGQFAAPGHVGAIKITGTMIGAVHWTSTNGRYGTFVLNTHVWSVSVGN